MASPSCSSATSPRRGRSPARACSNTRSTPCSHSKVSDITRWRLLRATKHRFGPTNELGLFEMVGHGLEGVPDPSQLFLGDRRTGVPGLGGGADHGGSTPARGRGPVAHHTGAAQRAGPPHHPGRRQQPPRAACWPCCNSAPASTSSSQDVYASTVGGVKLIEPGLDLAVCLASRERDHRTAHPARSRRVRRGRARRRESARSPMRRGASARPLDSDSAG